MHLDTIKKEFPVFEHDPTLAYLDSAATTLTPRSVLSAMSEYYEQCPVNVRRGMYSLGEKATMLFDDARKKVADFIHATPEEIIFTSGTTESINMLARILEPRMSIGSKIVLSRLEHHANLIPWQQLAKRTGAIITYIELTPDGHIDIASAREIINSQTKIVSISFSSNVLGTITSTQDILAIAKEVGAMTVMDAAQAVGHMEIDVQNLDCDFLAFSGHKMYGPKGIGVLYGKKKLLEALDPTVFGGDMIREVNYTDATWGELPHKFEAGTQNIPAIIGLGAATTFLESIGWGDIHAHEKDITAYTIAALKKVPGVTIIGPENTENRSGVISFIIDGIHPHDISEVLNARKIAVRVGHHCAMPLVRSLGLAGTVRISIGVYSTKSDIDRCVEGLYEVIRLFSV